MASIKSILFLWVVIFGCSTDFSFAKNAQRIIALSPHSVELLYAIGAGDRIVGTVEYADYPDAALKIPRIGSYTGIQIERVVELQPDLILGWMSGNKMTDLNKLESLGLNVVYSHPKNINEIADDLIRLGKLTGLEDAAESVANKVRFEYLKIKNDYINLAKVKVFYQLWDDPLRTVGPESWVSNLINDCNGTNLFDDTDNSYPQISLESVLTKNPSVIIIQHHSKEVSKRKEIWKKWTMIDAVKNNLMHTIDPDLLLRPTPRAIQGLQELCQAIDSAR